MPAHAKSCVLKVLLFLKEKSESLLPQEGEHENARERKLHCDSSAHVFILGPTKG